MFGSTCTYEDILLVLGLDGSDDSGGNHGLLPSFVQVVVEDSIPVAVVHVVAHLGVAVLGADVDLETDKEDGLNHMWRFVTFILGFKGLNRASDLPQQRSC